MIQPDAKTPDITYEIYQYLLQLSSNKIKPLPKITNIAKEIGISRAAIYAWINGDFGSEKITEYLKRVTGISFPVRVPDDKINTMRILFRIR